MPEQFRQIAVDDATLALWSAGEGETVIFVHAGIADSRMWESQIPVFSERFRTLRFDLRGFGRSTIPQQPFSYATDILAVMSSADVERAHLVAASFGGRVALDFTLEHPDCVQSLSLSGPAISGASWEDSDLIAGWEAMEEADARGDLQRVIEIENDLWLGGAGRSLESVSGAVRDLVVEMQRGIYERPWDDSLAEELERPAIGRLSEIDCPMLIVVGEYERPDIVRNCQWLAERVAGAQLAQIPDSAHLPPLEQPEAFNRLTLGFLAQ